MGVHNSLGKPGKAVMLGTKVDLKTVDTDTYAVAGIADHICPWSAVYGTTQLLGGDVEVRAQQQRSRRCHHQPARQSESQIPGGRRQPENRRRMAEVRDCRTRKLVARLQCVGGKARRRKGRRAHRARQRNVQTDRACPGKYISGTNTSPAGAQRRPNAARMADARAMQSGRTLIEWPVH